MTKSLKFAPHTRTHTIVLKGCTNHRGIFSPKSDDGWHRLRKSFVNAVESAGFTVTESAKGRHHLAGKPFGEGFGYTMVAVLSESDVGIHTYPEDEFGATVEIEFNLCYLRTDHMPRLQKAKKIFAKKYRATSARMTHSKRRYL